MSLWLEILKQVSVGNSSEAYRLLNFDLPLALRSFEFESGRARRYAGPVPKTVRMFITRLPESDRQMAKSRADDFADYITDLIVANVRRTVSLLEFCQAFPKFDIEQIAEGFTGWDGLKLGKVDRIKWVTRHLRSISAAAIQIPTDISNSLQQFNAEDEVFGYNELALLAKWKTDRSWQDFKSQQELDGAYVSMDSDVEEGPGVAEEVVDYGGITTARVVLSLSAAAMSELTVDLNRIGGQLTSDLLALLETFHEEKPSDGYLPIAWHNVWWNLVSKYEALPLQLSERDPFCDVDRTLAEYIGNAYPTVLKPNRLNIQRRRTRLQDKCVERAQAALIAWAQNQV
jgi:hypothetical protein